ncbi:hypothetical protein ACHRVW_22400 [Flavobacterium collinsii]|uniref:hypothetical protein n=1 Tax=Flavobacterium collinsii TaxID=1114861 RepID=UPI0037574346
MECKNVSGNDLRTNINLIIKKYTEESKLSSIIKKQYPSHYGKVSISNVSNEFYNLNKEQIIAKFRQELLNKEGGIVKDKFINSVHELHIENGKGRFIIKNTEW